MKDKVIQKLNKYLTMKAEVESYDYTADVEAELAKVKANLISVAEADKNARLAKIDIYIELLNSLLEEDKEEGLDSKEEITDEISEDTDITSTEEISKLDDEINEEV